MTSRMSHNQDELMHHMGYILILQYYNAAKRVILTFPTPLALIDCTLAVTARICPLEF